MAFTEASLVAQLDPAGATSESEDKSIDDTLRETLAAIHARGDGEDIEQEQGRDDSGRFAAKESEAKPQEEEPAQETPAAEEPPARPAPNTWRKEVADKWATLPAEVQAEVERREADFHKGIEQYRAKAQFGDAMERAILPYTQTLQSLGISPDRAVSELMAADHKLRHGTQSEKQQYFAQLAANYGIQLGETQQQETSPIDPRVSSLQQQMQQMSGWIQQQTEAAQQREQDALNSEIQRFRADPQHGHFDAVKGHMAALLQAGQAKDLQDAYEQAIYANPATRQALLKQQEDAIRKEKAAVAQAAKKAASANLRSKPSLPVSEPIGSMEDTIRATLRRLTA